jgi:hypothetical protein
MKAPVDVCAGTVPLTHAFVIVTSAAAENESSVAAVRRKALGHR